MSLLTNRSSDSNPSAYHHPNLSALARHLRRAVQTASADEPPTGWNHSRWLHTLAQAAGYRNHQNWLAENATDSVAINDQNTATPSGNDQKNGPGMPPEAGWRPQHYAQIRYASGADAAKPASDFSVGLAQIASVAPDLDDAAKLRVLRALSHFDRRGKLLRWPSKRGLADMVLWPLAQHFAEHERLTEGEVTQRLATLNGFNDPVTLRRELINLKLLQREANGASYWRNAQAQPSAESAALLAVMRARTGA